MDAVSISAGSIANADGLELKGLVLSPGVVSLHVNGRPARVRFSKDVIMSAYAKLRAKLARDGGIEMRLVHPDLHPLSIPFGRATSFQHDPNTGNVYLSDSAPLPEVASLFDAPAREALQKMGLSMRAPAKLSATKDAEADFDATELGDLTAVDVVDRGAFTGSHIAQHLPAGLVARISAAHAQGGFKVTSQSAGTNAAAQDTSGRPMPTIESVEQVPEEVRAMLQPEQLPAYIQAYNAGITAGLDPLAAHEAAMKSLAGTPVGQDGTMTKELEQVQARLSAANAEKATLAKENADLVAKLSAMQGENKTLDTRLKTIEADLAAAKAEKEQREANDDVQELLATGRASPAMREGLLLARASMGREKFAKLAATMPKVVPIGEMGRTNNESPADAEGVQRAERIYRSMDGDVNRIVSSGLGKTPEMMGLLSARHPDHPKVKALVNKAGA